MNAPKMTKSHFQFLALTLQKVIAHNNLDEEKAGWLVRSFVTELKKTNPAFNEHLFTQVAKGIP